MNQTFMQKKRLGILLTDEEVGTLMNTMNCNIQDVSNHSKRLEFLAKMMQTHKKRSKPCHCWILLHSDKLF